MTRREEYARHRDYIEAEGLDKLLDFHENSDYKASAFDSVSGRLEIPFPPQPGDLVRLHKTIRQRRCFTVMEFGLGYSTIVMADALEKNQADWERLPQAPEIRNRFMFQLFSVDTSSRWIENVVQRFPSHLVNRVHLQFSEVEIGLFNGQLCHYYKNLPNIIPDFIFSSYSRHRLSGWLHPGLSGSGCL